MEQLKKMRYIMDHVPHREKGEGLEFTRLFQEPNLYQT